MKIRYFNNKGEEIKGTCEPSYFFRNNPKEKRPPDFVIVKQAEITEGLTDPYGNEVQVTKLSDPIEEDYCRWVWEDGSWYCLVCLVVKKKEIIKDCRPTWWKFFEEFNANRPNLTR